MSALSMLARKHKLQTQVVCPHCWESHPPEEILWIAAHEEMRGDSMLADDHPNNGLRFAPSRFDELGNALDAKDFPCDGLACPHCHLGIARGLVEMPSFFFSILGSPGCGKSYYLASLIHSLRQHATQQFQLEFRDLDPAANQYLSTIEEALFLNQNSNDPQALGNLIAKTEVAGQGLYDEVRFGSQTVRYPKPYLFSLRPQENHANARFAHLIGRALCLYDNAGEHFLAGEDSVGTPVTRHLAKSKCLLFLFDPTQDPRFWRWCETEMTKKNQAASASLPAFKSERQFRQETLLHEAAARVRRLKGLAQNQKHDSHLIVLVTKCDIWAELLEWYPSKEPYQIRQSQGHSVHMLDVPKILSVSQSLRKLLVDLCPDMVHAAESFCQKVTFMPVSALGNKPFVHQSTGKRSIVPKDISPRWVTAPLVYGIHQFVPGLFGALKVKSSKTA